MKKRFRGKCAYCCEREAVTEDHVFAKGFFFRADRDNKALPRAPACEECNNAKSKLDEYAMTVLAFGGTHASALPFLTETGIRRMQNNRALHQELQEGRKEVWVTEASGIILPTSTLPIKGEPLAELFQYIGKGLIWHHWKGFLDGDDSVRVMFLTEAGDDDLRQKFGAWQGERVREDLRRGTVQYEGLRDPNDPQFSAWRVRLFGGVNIASADPAHGVCRTIGIFTSRLANTAAA